MGEADFLRCCGSTAWARAMAEGWPFPSGEALYSAAEEIWWNLEEADWLEAFAAHPRIGERDIAERWASAEQAGAEGASDETLAALAKANAAYEARFGHIFLICATGLTAEQMLGSLRRRLANDPGVELQVAATEQARITRLRLDRIVDLDGRNTVTLSTHVLDTTSGRPASGVRVTLEREDPADSDAAAAGWTTLATAVTDEDGRVASFANASGEDASDLDPGAYRLRFETGAYFEALGLDAFHPHVEVVFRLSGGAGHTHVPLLLSPFGYTTYRGS